MSKELKFVPLEKHSYTLKPEGYKILTPPNNPILRWVVTKLWKRMIEAGILSQFHYKRVFYSYGKLQSYRLEELINRQVVDLVQRGFNINDYCVVMGGKEFSDLLGGVADLGMSYTIHMDGLYYNTDGGYKGIIRGLPVHVVNGFSGLVILPKVILEKKVSLTE